jgi:solute carrier family 26 (sodium-independent sulfate anion transporter), member 11
LEKFKITIQTGDIKPGLPPFNLPTFSLNKTDGNQTEYLEFMDVLSESGSAIGLISLIAILEHVAIAKAFGKCSFK